MIKLICSDLDGTLIPYGAPSVIGEDVFELIRRLAAQNIVFCPASGRQYASLRKLFAPVAEHCAFLCENGAALFYGEKLLAKTVIPRAAAEQIALDFWNNSDGKGEVMLCSENMAYMMSRNLGMVDQMHSFGYRYTYISAPKEIPEDIIKVSLFVGDGVAPFADRFMPRWKAYNAVVAGPVWIDTMLANKGIGVQKLCEILKLKPNEVMAFGDNFNDEAMLDFVGLPYIMDTAPQRLLAKYPNHTAEPHCIIRDLIDRLPSTKT